LCLEEDEAENARMAWTRERFCSLQVTPLPSKVMAIVTSHVTSAKGVIDPWRVMRVAATVARDGARR
jgi:hypothetical protein